jgi:predicted PhzF superfamily epimerase YddE/YHI9
VKLPLFQIDAFASSVFKGNPAAVVPLERWLPDVVLQAIAAENNLSETAFFVPEGEGFHIRWMTPTTEVNLCGHATLASAYVILDILEPRRQEVRFTSQSGPLWVRRDGAYLAMDFPSWMPLPVEVPDALVRGLGKAPRQVLAARDFLAVYESEDDVRALEPDYEMLGKLDRGCGIIVTAPGKRHDFVSRFFGPQVGIKEDPVTGSAHCALVPFWAARLQKPRLHAFQASRRGGELFCELRGDRVILSGAAAKYLEGTLYLPD